MRPNLKINIISTVHRPMPRTWVILETIELSSMKLISSGDGTMPSFTFSARSRMASILLRDRPVDLSWSSASVSISSGSGNSFSGTSLINRRSIAFAAAPCSCCDAMARVSASKGDCSRLFLPVRYKVGTKWGQINLNLATPNKGIHA